MLCLMNSKFVAHSRPRLGLTSCSVAAFNNLVRLEAKYGAFSRRRIAALSEARNAAAQCLTSVRSQIQMHDRAMQAHARQTFAVGPLPEALQRWVR